MEAGGVRGAGYAAALHAVSVCGLESSGAAFSNAPERGVANSLGAGSEKFVGTLTSQKFRMPKLWVHVRIGGTKSDAK